ncbi:MAG: 30S ribosomal protein S12 methylthiotransferase RimO [Prevotellaceae bacterium]|nr:30S ribosomal protein S12 methylthiotransferase RimO [Prevotellaceae bacterium]
MKKQKVNIVTLGCSKNTVDSEHLMSQLSGNGFEVIHDSNDTSVKIVVINTCGFIADAKEESINAILSFAHAKEQGLIKHLFILGCLAERYKKDLQAEIPEVDEFFGVNNLADVLKAVGGAYRENLIGERVLTTPNHYAYLKISEGCNWGCSYCAIPLIRGKHVSVPIEQLVDEAKLLADKGVKELLVIAQDTTYYGLDIYKKRRLANLLEKLSLINGIEWIRLHYAYPTNFPDDLFSAIRDNDKICKYLDMPFQHISNKVLKNMRRGINKSETYSLIKKLREQIPGIAIRTTLLVGHPGEGKQEFEELKQFVTDVRFERLGVFPYSEEENTYSAQQFKDSLSGKIKQQRADEIMKLQNTISLQLNESRVGECCKIIIDREEGDYLVGRTEFDSPEIDQEVLVKKVSSIKSGDFVSVKITEVDDYDLYGISI